MSGETRSNESMTAKEQSDMWKEANFDGVDERKPVVIKNRLLAKRCRRIWFR